MRLESLRRGPCVDSGPQKKRMIIVTFSRVSSPSASFSSAAGTFPRESVLVQTSPSASSSPGLRQFLGGQVPK